MDFRLALFGYPRLLGTERRVAHAASKTFALAAFLLLRGHGNTASRAAIRQFLWDSEDEKQASANMRKFLARERQRVEAGGEPLFVGEGAHVTLVMPRGAIDLADFLRRTAAPGAEDIIPLCHIYRGDLLEGSVADGTTLSEWLESERTKLRETFMSTIAALIEPGHDVGQVALRVGARRLIEVDPYNETARRALMRHFAEEGETARVRDTYSSLEKRLRDDLDARPDADTYELFRQLAPLPARAIAHPPPALAPIPLAEIEATSARRRAASWIAVQDHAGTPRIAVLPPADTRPLDHRQIASSLVEDVTIGLCRLKTLSVVAHHTAAVLGQNRSADLREFQIDYAVETQLVERDGEDVLAVKLIDVLAGNVIVWDEHYDFDALQLAHSYRELSLRIVGSLAERVERVELARYDRDPNPMAYHLFLAGQQFQRRLDLQNARRARRLFKRALHAAPDFVPALSGLARTYHVEWLLMARGDADILAQAEQLARESIAIDPDDARGYRELGICNAYSGRFDEALEAMAQGEQCHPQYADLLGDYADALVHACEPTLALQKIWRAIELNPICPDNYWWAAGGANFQLQRYHAAIDCLSRMREQAPAYRLLAACHAMLGEREAAGRYVAMTRETHPDFEISAFLSVVPFRDATIVKKYEQGLREAGFR